MSEGPVSSFHVGNRILSNPFESLGEAWCPKCKAVVDCDTESSHRGTQYVWSRRCPRCGTVVSWGAYQHVPILEAADMGKQVQAIQFVTRPGADRRGPIRGRASL
jgi:endogenous inhibitor of DNA gyrase (YacG/DUF329 family)